MAPNGFPYGGLTWETLCGEQLHIKTGRAGVCAPVTPALPPSKRRFHMDTPSQPESHQAVAPGWLAYDLTPDDVAPLLDRFISRFVPGAPEECWLWQGGRFANGYGRISRSSYHAWGQHLLAHRVSWVAFTGTPIVGRLTIDHLCNTKLCINPDHLEVVTLHENIRRKNERLGYEIGARTGNEGRRKRRPSTQRKPPSEASVQRNRENALRYYHEHKDEILAARRGKPRPFRMVTCDHCGKGIRDDGIRRHVRRMHSGAV